MQYLQEHPSRWHFDPSKHATPAANFIAGKSVFVTEVDDYELYRSMLYALGAKSVANKMMAHVNLVVHGGAQPPQKARAKYPTGEFVHADAVLPLFHQTNRNFGEFIQALEKQGFTVRNPSDEGDALFDFFELPLVNDSLGDTLLEYLRTSPFIRKFVRKQSFPIEKREAVYIEFPVPNTDITWHYAWVPSGWSRVSAKRGEGNYPLEITGGQIMRIAPAFWKQSIGMYFYEYPHTESILGLFIHAGIDARTGMLSGGAVSRVWT